MLGPDRLRRLRRQRRRKERNRRGPLAHSSLWQDGKAGPIRRTPADDCKTDDVTVIPAVILGYRSAANAAELPAAWLSFGVNVGLPAPQAFGEQMFGNVYAGKRVVVT